LPIENSCGGLKQNKGIGGFKGEVPSLPITGVSLGSLKPITAS